MTAGRASTEQYVILPAIDALCPRYDCRMDLVIKLNKLDKIIFWSLQLNRIAGRILLYYEVLKTIRMNALHD